MIDSFDVQKTTVSPIDGQQSIDCAFTTTTRAPLTQNQIQANYEANRAAFHAQLSKLFYGAGIVHNPADCKDPTKWKGSWTMFYDRYQHPIQEFRERLLVLREKIPFILETLESMRDE